MNEMSNPQQEELLEKYREHLIFYERVDVMRTVDITTVYGRVKEVEMIIARIERRGEITEEEREHIARRLREALDAVTKPADDDS